MDSLSGLRVAIYARHSTHMQTGSAEDQIARCITLVEQQGGQVGGIYRDEARTGATTAHRDGINRLVDDAAHERFDAVLFEDLSRLSRDIADTAAVFRDLTYAGITLHSVTEGRISALHIGLKGTMNQLFLTDLRDKSRRGLRASVKRGRVLNYPYGYEKIPMFDESGKQVPGQARINPAQAAVVRRIFEECAEGKPIAEIVGDLNRDGIPSPKGGKMVEDIAVRRAPPQGWHPPSTDVCRRVRLGQVLLSHGPQDRQEDPPTPPQDRLGDQGGPTPCDHRQGTLGESAGRPGPGPPPAAEEQTAPPAVPSRRSQAPPDLWNQPLHPVRGASHASSGRMDPLLPTRQPAVLRPGIPDAAPFRRPQGVAGAPDEAREPPPLAA